jgi:oligopeptide transport system ATP-binding protein
MIEVGMAEKLLDVRNLRTHFFTRAGVVKAIEDVSFYLAPGETLGLVGESGCGKSVTSLSVMRLVEDPPGKIVGGEIIFKGDDILDLNEDQLRKIRGGNIAMIFQDPMTSLNPVLTIGQQLTETIKAHLKVDDRAATERAVEMLDRVRIPEARRRLSSYPHEFSGGMRQRVMIAIALSCNPELLIADEPTTALDVTIQAQVLELIDALGKEFNTATLLITHDLGVVAGTCDRVHVMYAGRIVEATDTRTLFKMPAHPYTQALLKAVPRPDEQRGAKLNAIGGRPPILIDLPPGCAFAPRCPKAQPRCRQETPPLMDVGPNQKAACFYPY